VEQNLGSALILEDDIDWDIRLKSQLQTFALASQALLSDVTTSAPKTKSGQSEEEIALQNSFPLKSLPFSPRPSLSPYGDDWDILWLGHCGTAFRASSPLSRILIPSDSTVPSPKHLKPHPFAYQDSYSILYPPHTRVIHHPSGSSCSLAYALSQRGARKLLYEFGVKTFDKQIDFMLGDFCDRYGVLNSTSSCKERGTCGLGRGESEGVCVTVQPPLFSHHWPEGGSSDIYATGGGFVTMVGTLYVRWSTRLNLGRLVRGSREFIDQWPDK
jgi:hypothetical protein